MMVARTMCGRLGCCCLVLIIVVALAAGADNSADLSPADSTAHADRQQPIGEPDTDKSENQLDLKTLDKELFKRLFVKRRKEHLEAVENLQKIGNYERQYKMINMLAEKMLEVIESKKILLENVTESELKNVSFVAAESNSKTDIADAISNVLENIALFGEVAQRLPDITQRVLRKQPKWNSAMSWSSEFLNRTQDLLDKSTLQTIMLALRELNVTKRREEEHESSAGVHPNKIPSLGPTNQPKNAKKEANKKRERRKKGPTMTRVEL